jgi:DUF971 family protein
LKKRALAAGVDAVVIEDVDDEDDPKEAILTLLLDLHRKELEAAAADNGAEAEAELAALRAELAPMKMSVLKKRALAAGVNEEVIEDVDDADDPKDELVSILVEERRKTLVVSQDDGAVNVVELEALRAELAPMKMSAMRKRALAAGVNEEVIEDVDDADDPKDELVSILVEERRKTLVVSQDDGAAAQAELEALRAELASMKVSALRKRALAAGVGTEDLEAAVDADDPRAAIESLLLDGAVHQSKGAPRVKGDPPGRPHFGAGDIGAGGGAGFEREPAPPPQAFSGKHAMLSYQWDIQKRVGTAKLFNVPLTYRIIPIKYR